MPHSVPDVPHILSLRVENRAGALSRIAGLFSARGFNIDSLTVAPTADPTVSAMTIVTRGDDGVVEQITKQLNKQIDVIKVVNAVGDDYVRRETLLVKIHTRAEHRAEALRVVDIFRARVVDSSTNSYTVEVTGSSGKLDALVNMLRPLGIKELVRTGKVALPRELNPKRKD